MLATDLKTGRIFKDNDQPFLVVRYEHIKSARGGATIKVKAKNLLSGSVLEKSYLNSSRVEEADVLRKNAQYLYKDEGSYVFMDPDTYDQMNFSPEVVGEAVRFLMEGEVCQVLYFEGRPVTVDLPNNLVFEVTYTEPGFKGNTVSNVLKEATLNNGAVVRVPTFIKIGDKVRIDTRTGDYVSKA
jgi:elongation factor P